MFEKYFCDWNSPTLFLLIRQRDKPKQTDGSPLALFNYFIERTKEMLHIVLAMSPIGDAFRNRLRKFPSLINCCTIDWFQVLIFSIFCCLIFCTSSLLFFFFHVIFTETSSTHSSVSNINAPLSASPTKWSNTLKEFELWGWHLQDYVACIFLLTDFYAMFPCFQGI